MNTIYNNPDNYSCNSTLVPSGAEIASFSIRIGEFIRHSVVYYDSTPLENVELDDIDVAIIEEIIRSKQLTALQIAQFVALRGFKAEQSVIQDKLMRLVELRITQEFQIVAYDRDENGLKYYELDFKGNQYAYNNGIFMHSGNKYRSFSRKKELGEVDTPTDVKRVLMGNQIVLGLLINGAMLCRFGMMETFRSKGSGYQQIFRTSSNVKLDDKSVLAYDVVRDVPAGYTKLADKVARYYKLLDSAEYLEDNYHGDASMPQLVVCGQSKAHNLKLAAYLKEQGLWREEDPILFTEDALNVKNSLQSLYLINDDDTLTWYGIPTRDEELCCF